ncbi:SdpI family protein [Abyssisolibacter fermentans]|uniref:SdpI family protein n=1 Tax=Abyssisolibacter fermentans TaxID=1766203 RepID=UPI00082AC339|nr:SdpI family protein [Abyssisolibacter fermentans]
MKVNKILIILILLSIVCTAFVYSYIPNEVPSHWNIKGAIDEYQSKEFVFFTASLPLLLYVFMIIIPKIDPKKKSYMKHKKAYRIFIYALILFFIVIHWLTIGVSLDYNLNISSYIKIGVGLLFIILGNYMGQLRHNYTFGIKTPWTLASEKVWKKTHKAGGYGFIISGLIFILTAIFNNEMSFYIALGSLLIIVLALTIYSYLLYKKLENN